MSIVEKSRPYLLLLLTLVLGIAIGFLGSGLLVRNKIQDLRKMQTREGMAVSLERMLDLSEEQIPLVRPVLEEHAVHMRDLWDHHRQERRAEIDKLFKALGPVLSPVQLQSLQDRTRRMLNGKPHGGRGPDEDLPPPMP
jgi:hypothetical protein